MTRSFAELDRDQNAGAEELCAVLNDYAVGGAGINEDMVIRLIQRTQPDRPQLTRLLASARKGGQSQYLRGFVRDRTAYDGVAHFVQGVLEGAITLHIGPPPQSSRR